MRLSPRHLASIPLIVGFINGQGQMPIRRACVISSLFIIGILLAIAAIDVTTAAAGRMWGDVGAWGNNRVAAAIIYPLDLLTIHGRQRLAGLQYPLLSGDTIPAGPSTSVSVCRDIYLLALRTTIC
ncbi:hypothetical protein JCM30471_08150 [Desulfuromonas carbonis]